MTHMGLHRMTVQLGDIAAEAERLLANQHPPAAGELRTLAAFARKAALAAVRAQSGMHEEQAP